MPRMSDAEKRKSHDRILDAAATLFRENGIETTSVAEVMKAAGMTHGGFYRHFADKDELVAKAFRRAVDGVVSPMETPQTVHGKAAARTAYIDAYLAREHVESRGKGCPMAALASELVRAEDGITQETTAAVDRVAALLHGGGQGHKDYAQLALLVGSLTLARMTDDEAQTQSILDAGKAAITHLSD